MEFLALVLQITNIDVCSLAQVKVTFCKQPEHCLKYKASVKLVKKIVAINIYISAHYTTRIMHS